MELYQILKGANTMNENTNTTVLPATKTKKPRQFRKTISIMQKREIIKMCEDLKAIGKKYKIDEAEKTTLNNVMYCLQKTWEQLNEDNNIIQM